MPTDERSTNRYTMDGYRLCGDRELFVIDTATGDQVDVTVAATEMLFLDETDRTFYVTPTEVGTW